MNGPVFLSRFIGRKKEVGEIRSLVRERAVRLLTLTGPGGCGKTRLACESLSELADTFEDGIAWVGLAGQSHPEAVSQEIAASLNIGTAPGQSLLSALVATLQQRETLIILDNCEHLIEASAQLVDTLLRACPELHFVATSRQKLGVEGEQVWPVPPLSYPADGSAQVNSLVDYDALQLFYARARLVQPKFEDNARNRLAVGSIVRLLEGMPLAIELAAARVNELDMPDMVKRLEHQLSFLTGKGHTIAARHQSMRETIQWSFQLLASAEQILFRRLGVFSGGFSSEAVEAVCGEQPLVEGLVPDLLGKLIDKSLVIRESGQQADSRYRQLESIRQFATGTLREAGEEERVRDRHLVYFSSLAREAEPHLLGPDQKHWTETLERDYDNLETALAWSLHKAKGDDRFLLDAVTMAKYLYWFWNYSGRHEAARSWYAEMHELKGLDRNSAWYADLKHHLATFIWLLGNYPHAQEQLYDSLQIAQAADYPQGIGHAQLMLGILSLHQGQVEQALALLQESEELFSALEDRRGLVIAYTNLGGAYRAAGDLDTALVYAEKAVRNARANQDLWGLGLSLSGLGDVLYKKGEGKRAFLLMEEALGLIQSSGQQWLQAEALWRLGEMMLDQGDPVGAQKRLEQCYDLAQESGAVEWQLSALKSLGFLSLNQGQDQQAAGHFSEIFRLTGGNRYEHILVHSLLGTIWLAAASQQWRQAVVLWKAYESLRAASKLPPFAQETHVDRFLQPYRETSPARVEGQVSTLAEATGLALEITQGFESRVTVIPSKYKLRVLGLGPTEVYLNGQMLVPSDWTFAKPKELLYYLISNSPKTKEQIGIVFWPDASPSHLRTSLRATLYHLRRALGKRGWVLYEDGYYKFNRSMDHWYDVDAFEGMVGSVERSAQDEVVIETLEEAVSLYRGDFLSDLSNDEWGTLRREELRNKYLGAMSLLGKLLLKRRAYDRAIEVYRSLLSADILMEEAHRALMRCYVQMGERALALRQYQTLVEILQDELGVLPSSETTGLYQSIQQNSI